jgi:hypothetical protein
MDVAEKVYSGVDWDDTAAVQARGATVKLTEHGLAEQCGD